jgi:cytochrome c-type biogenesis protein CcmF
MASVGGVLLALAFFVAAASAVTAVVWRHDDARVILARRGVYLVFGLLLVCIILIEVAMATNEFHLNIVAEHSSRETPMFYKLAAMWSSQEGSLLLWAFVLSVAASLALYSTRHKLREIVPWATGVMMAIGTFFIGLMLFAPGVNPFHTIPTPQDGIGLNPLLQHPSMMIHPPMLYSGYVAWTVPFAFAIGALITRKVDSEWIRATRKFALIAWTFLGFGLLLGARWSYSELGWGGYWAWDPVENAALMPWLLGTAFLHSIMVQEKRSMLKVWNATLIVATFSMCLLGTFLVRSGVLQSIHAFGDDTVGPYLLAVIGIVVIGSTCLIVSRLDDLKSGQKRIDSLLSRESIFLVNNLLLVGLVVVIAWGTFFPLISELFTGNKSSLAAPWYDKYTTPLGILLVLFTGIGPLLAWRRVTWASARRVFRVPFAIAVLTLIVLVVFTDAGNKFWPTALFTFAAFAIAGVLQEFYNGAHARQKISGGSFLGALFAVTARNRRRYGGYIAHIGIAVLLIGIAASSSFQTNENVSMKPGETRVVDGREFTYKRPYVKVDNEKYTIGAVVEVKQDGKYLTTLETSRRFFRPTGAAATGGLADYFSGEATSEVGLKTGLVRDIWVTVAPNVQKVQHQLGVAEKGLEQCIKAGPGTPEQCKQLRELMQAAAAEPRLQPAALKQIESLQLLSAERIARGYVKEAGTATFKVIVNPLVLWMWIGGIIGLVGALIAVWPTRSRRKGAMVRTEADELKEAKYREIRDAELDHASGKLSDEDYAILDAELRKEAVEILDTVGVGAGSGETLRVGRAGLPEDWVGDAEDGPFGNGNGNGTNGHANGNGHAASGNGDGHPEGHANGNGNGNGSASEPADRD